MTPIELAALAAAVGAASWGGTALVLRYLERRAILDRPNERSSHRRPTPRGGGLAVVPVALAAWGGLGVASGAEPLFWIVLAAAAALAAVSWIDDVRGLSPAPRLLSHLLAIAAVLASMPSDWTIFQGLIPPALDRVAAGLLWVWFVNLYNFMDGIDGITSTETASIGIGAAVVAALAGGIVVAGVGVAPLGIALAATAGGFLMLNWHPARIFLGDVGSVPLGFLCGWLLIALAAAGHWPAALILPAYYWADATITLARRAARLQPVWQAHREHAYQKAVAAGTPHDRVVLRIAALNLVLIVLAAAASPWPEAALALSTIATAWLLRRLARGAPAAARTGAPDADCA
ncbi:MAG: MraY family glycosyltransferase [Gemmatimonas sp.]